MNDPTTTPTRWIALADAQPSAGDYPIWLATVGVERSVLVTKEGKLPDGHTHWAHADVPAGPTSPTLREHDEAACLAAWRALGPEYLGDTKWKVNCFWWKAWHVAIASERAAIRTLVEAPAPSFYDTCLVIEKRVGATIDHEVAT